MNTKPNLTPLLQKGWHGILVEPHPMCISQLMQEVSKYSADVYCGVVAPNDGFVDFCSRNSETFDKVDREGRVHTEVSGILHKNFFKSSFIKFAPISLEKLIQASPYPVHRVEVDCEGLELAIFEHFSFHKKPNVFKIAYHSDEIRHRLRRIFQEHGYTVNNIDAEHILCTIGNPELDVIEIFPSN